MLQECPKPIIGNLEEDIFNFSNDTLVTKQSGSSKTYTFTKAYKRCLVMWSRYNSSAVETSLGFTGCEVESKSDFWYGNYSGYTANAGAYIIKDVQIGATITSNTYQGFIVYALEE